MPEFGFEDIVAITWEALKNPLPLALFLAIFMQVIGKDLVDAILDSIFQIFRLQHVAAEWSRRNLVINLVTWLLGLLVTWMQTNEEFTLGQAVTVSVIAAFLSIGAFEFIKNGFMARGYDKSE